MNARNSGASEDEILTLSEDIKVESGIKTVGPGRNSLFELKEGIAILEYILDPDRSRGFPLNQRVVFTNVNLFPFCSIPIQSTYCYSDLSKNCTRKDVQTGT